jgi:hypothetical protein
MRDIFNAFMNYGNRLPKKLITPVESYNRMKDEAGTEVTRVTLKYSLFYYWQYFLVVFKVLYRESLYAKTGYHLGRK